MKKTFITVAAASLAILAALTSIAIYAKQRDARQSDINKAVCVSVVRLDLAISETLQRSLKSLPKIQYYREHPAELRTAQRETRISLRKFVPPRACVGAIPAPRR